MVGSNKDLIHSHLSNFKWSLLNMITKEKIIANFENFGSEPSVNLVDRQLVDVDLQLLLEVLQPVVVLLLLVWKMSKMNHSIGFEL